MGPKEESQKTLLCQDLFICARSTLKSLICSLSLLKMENSVEAVNVRIDHPKIRNVSFCVSTMVFALGFLLCIIFGATGPDVFTEVQGDVFNATLHSGGNFLWQESISDMRKSHRLMWLTVTFERPGWGLFGVGKDFDLDYDQRMTLKVIGIDEDGKQMVLNSHANHTRTVTCLAGEEFCEDMLVFYEPYIQYPNYEVEIKFYHPAQIYDDATDTVNTKLSSTFNFVNADFTSFEMAFSYFFLAVTILVMFMPLQGFLWRMFQLPRSLWSTQQKWITALLCLLFFFDNPFIAAEVKYGSKELGDFYMVAATTFVSVMLFFWLRLLNGLKYNCFGKPMQALHQPHQEVLSEKKYKLRLVGECLLCWFILAITLAAYVVNRRMETIDPAYSGVSELNPQNLPFVVLLSIAMVVYILWVSLSLFQCIASIKCMPSAYLFLLSITLFSLFVAIVGIFMAAYFPIRSTAAAFSCFFGLFNLYIWALALCYTPTGKRFRSFKVNEVESIEFFDDFELPQIDEKNDQPPNGTFHDV